MHLHQYLLQPDALTARQLGEGLDCPPAMIRQWVAKDEHGAFKRWPGPAYATGLERLTGGLVARWDSRPTDWHRVWPELVGTKGAPAVPVPATAES